MKRCLAGFLKNSTHWIFYSAPLWNSTGQRRLFVSLQVTKEGWCGGTGLLFLWRVSLLLFSRAVPEVRCREDTSPSIPELSAARSAMDLRLLRGSWGCRGQRRGETGENHWKHPGCAWGRGQTMMRAKKGFGKSFVLQSHLVVCAELYNSHQSMMLYILQ